MKDMLMKNEVSKVLGISKSTIRYYEQIGLIEPYIDENNYRYYRIDELKLLSQIAFLRNNDFDIDSIRKLIDSDDTHKYLLEKSEDLRNIIEKYKRNLSIIEEIITCTENLNKESLVEIKHYGDRYLYEVKGHESLGDFFEKNKEYFSDNKLGLGGWFVKSLDVKSFFNGEYGFKEQMFDSRCSTESKLVVSGEYFCYSINFDDKEISWPDLAKSINEEIRKKELILREGDVLFINKDNMYFNFKKFSRIITIEVPIEKRKS